MAYITKTEVQAMRAALKPICKKYGMKVTLSGSNSSSVTATIQSGSIDLIGNYIEKRKNSINNWQTNDEEIKYIKEKCYVQVNHYYLDRQFTGIALDFMNEVMKVISHGHWDESDAMTDYFHCAWYRHIHIGKWNKPYEYCSA